MNRNMMTLLALAAGLSIGAAVRASASVPLIAFAHLFLPLGTLWLNGLKMTLVPLVFALVAYGMVVLDRSGGGGRLLALTLPLLIGVLALGVAGGMAFGVLFDTVWPVLPGVAGSLAAAPMAMPDKVPTLFDMIVALIPTNPIAAASEGALAAIVVFAIIFGFAASRVDAVIGEPIVRFLHGLAEVMMRIVHWVLWFTPIGIFALSMGLALDTGLAMAGFLAQLVIAVIGASLLTLVFGYVLAWVGGGVAPLRFGRAIIGAQAMAAGTTSSAATLPMMIEASEQQLQIPERIVGAVLPLTVSIFRLASVVYTSALVILFLRAMNMPLDPAKLAIGGALLMLGVMSTGGLPGVAVIYAASIGAYKFLGLPIEFIPLTIAVSSFPDLIITPANVTADLAVTTIVARLVGTAERDTP
jgi:Na+/H+-dicarboxylate symporter